MNGDDIEAAANWLAEEGAQDCKNTLIARRKVLLAEAEVINDKINTRNEHDIQVKDDSILFPYDIMDSAWTINDGQLTLNKYFRNEIATKVFSIHEEDIKVLQSEDDKEDEKKQVQELSTAPIANELESPVLKRSDRVDLDGQQLMTTSTHDIALSMYEKLTLKGSYIKSIKDIKLLDYAMDLSYDHKYCKFYGLVSSQNTKVVLVAQDMSQMKETTFSTEDDFEKAGISIPKDDEEKLTLKGLVQQTLDFFSHFERLRFELPWRWRRWSTVFSSASDLSPIKDAKITKRHEKVRDYELNQWREKFGLDQLTISSKGKKSKPTPQPQPTNIYSQASLVQDSGNYKEVPIRIEERKMEAFCISGDVQTLENLFNIIKKAQKDFKELVMDQQKDLGKESNFKEGDNKTQVKQNHVSELIMVLLKQLAYWVRVSDTLVASPTEGNPRLLDQVGEHLLRFATVEFDESILVDLHEYYRLLWVVMINGFEVFYRSTESQYNFIKALFTNSFKYKKQSSNKPRGSSVHYHYYLDCFNQNLSPIQLFYICHFKYPQTFLFRAPMVCSEIKEFSVKFRLEDEVKDKLQNTNTLKNSGYDYTNPYGNKFVQKQQQFFNLISGGGVIDCKLNEIEQEYEKVKTQKLGKLHLETIQDIQTCTSVSQKDY